MVFILSKMISFQLLSGRVQCEVIVAQSRITNRFSETVCQLLCGITALRASTRLPYGGARLVLGWVTVSGFNCWCGTFASVCDHPNRSTQPDHSFVGRYNQGLNSVGAGGS